MTGEFFGIPFSLTRDAAGGIAFACAAFAFWTTYRAIATGEHTWKNDKVCRAETPALFMIHVGVSFFLGFAALAGGVIMTLDLGMKP